MAGERDQGLQALQNGDTATAIGLLETATASDAADYQAHIYLGAAYSKSGRTEDAIRVLTRAVELQPSNPQARYNLGIAMERGGHPEQAAAVFEQALTLQPDYPKAAEALQRARAALAPAPTPQPAPSYAGSAYDVPGPSSGAGTESAAQAPPAPLYGAPPPVQPQNLYGAPGAGPGGSAPGQSSSMYGAPGPSPAGGGLAEGQTPSMYGAPTPPQPQYGAPGTQPGAAGQVAYGPGAVQPAGPYPYKPPAPNAAYTVPNAAPTTAAKAAGLVLAVVLGLIGAVVGLVAWIAIAYYGHIQIGWAAIGVGALVGWMVKLGARQGSTMTGVIAAVLTLLAFGILLILQLGDPASVAFSVLFMVIGVSAAFRVGSRP